MLSHVNVGTGEDLPDQPSWRQLVRDIVGFRGEIEFDASFPDGTRPEAARRIAAEGARLGGEGHPAGGDRRHLRLVSAGLADLKEPA